MKKVIGEYFVDYVEEVDGWGIFHTDIKPGHCFIYFYSEKEAEERAVEMNNRQ